MVKNTTKTVDSIGEIALIGNIIPHLWYNNLKGQDGKPYLNAITILSEIVYWYKPTYVHDESTGELVEIKKKFKADKLQRNYDGLASKFGLSHKQVKTAIMYLRDKGLITIEYRTLRIEQVSGYPLVLNNVIFLEPIPEAIKALCTDPLSLEVQTPLSLEVQTPLSLEGHTNTKTTYTEITDTKKEERIKDPYSVSGETGFRSSRSSSRSSVQNNTEPSRKSKNTQSPENKFLISNADWKKYSPELYSLFSKFEILTARFPQGYEPDAPQSPEFSIGLTKTIQRSALALKAYLTGKFLDHFDIDKNYVLGKFPRAYQFLTGDRTTEYPISALIGSLRHYSRLFDTGTWPEDKSVLTKDFLEFMFNPRSKRSWFLYSLDKYLSGDISGEGGTHGLSEGTLKMLKGMIEAEFFPDLGSDHIARLGEWWAWFHPRSVKAIRESAGMTEIEFKCTWGPTINDDEYWIDDYTDFLWEKGSGSIPSAIIGGGSKWALSYAKKWARENDFFWPED